MDIIIGGVILFSILVAGVVITPTVKFAIDMAPYLYTNTRCSGKSGLILDKGTYDGLCGSNYFKETLAMLENTYYSNIVEKAKTFHELSRMLDKDLFQTYRWLHSVSPVKMAPIVEAISLKFEINQIKDTVNNIRMHNTFGKLDHITDDKLKIDLESSTDMNSLVSVLERSKYGEVFKGKEVEEAIAGLDIYYLENVMKAINNCTDKRASESFRQYWASVIDLVNIRLAIKKVRYKTEPVFAKGGNILQKSLNGITDSNHLYDLIQKSDYKEFIQEMNSDFEIEAGVYRYIKNKGNLISAKDPIKAGAMIRFIVQKELEVRNLNIILKLKEDEIQGEEIQKLVI